MRVVRIKSAVSSAYLVVDDKAILIDAGHPGQADRILAAVRRAGVEEQDISLLLHTHGHGDHAGSSAELKRRLRLPVAVHAADADLLRRGDNGRVTPRGLEGRLIAAAVVRPYEPVEPDVVLTDYLLAIESAVFAASLWHGSSASPIGRSFALFFAAIGVSA